MEKVIKNTFQLRILRMLRIHFSGFITTFSKANPEKNHFLTDRDNSEKTTKKYQTGENFG